MSEEIVFRVVLADGEVREVAAERASNKSQWRAEYSLDNGHHSHEYARGAVASLVAALGWDFVEIVGHGEPTRAELNATIAELRNEVAMLNVSIEDTINR
jgi:hypothetical protein